MKALIYNGIIMLSSIIILNKSVFSQNCKEFLLLADSLVEMNQFEEATVLYEKCMDISEYNFNNMYYASKALSMVNKDLDFALECLNSFLEGNKSIVGGVMEWMVLDTVYYNLHNHKNWEAYVDKYYYYANLNKPIMTEIEKKIMSMRELDLILEDTLVMYPCMLIPETTNLYLNEKRNFLNQEVISVLDSLKHWPTHEEVGWTAYTEFFFLIQHSGNLEIYKRGLKYSKKAMKKGVLDVTCYMLIKDRILTVKGKKQLYGTQGSCTLDIYPIKNPKKLEKRVKKLEKKYKK